MTTLINCTVESNEMPSTSCPAHLIPDTKSLWFVAYISELQAKDLNIVDYTHEIDYPRSELTAKLREALTFLSEDEIEELQNEYYVKFYEKE